VGGRVRGLSPLQEGLLCLRAADLPASLAAWPPVFPHNTPAHLPLPLRLPARRMTEKEGADGMMKQAVRCGPAGSQ